MWSFNSLDGSSLKVTGNFILRKRYFKGVQGSERVSKSRLYLEAKRCQGIIETCMMRLHTLSVGFGADEPIDTMNKSVNQLF